MHEAQFCYLLPLLLLVISLSSFFSFNDTATTEIYTLSLHDALPICEPRRGRWVVEGPAFILGELRDIAAAQSNSSDRKSTRLNSSHVAISYAVFCLKKKKKKKNKH